MGNLMSSIMQRGVLGHNHCPAQLPDNPWPHSALDYHPRTPAFDVLASPAGYYLVAMTH